MTDHLKTILTRQFEAALAMMSGGPRDGAAHPRAAREHERHRECGEGAGRDQGLASPHGSSTEKTAPPSGRFSPRSRPPCSVTMP